MTSKKLAEKAAELESHTEKFLADASGVVYSAVNSVSGKPWTETELSGYDAFQLPGVPASDLLSYENCGMTTGAYLAAMTLKYQVCGKQDDLMKAKRCFNGVKHIYEIGKQKEPGFFPKIYGGKYSEQISSDQYIYALKGMDIFYDTASDTERAGIRDMTEKMVDFWIRCNYVHNYYTIKNLRWPRGRFPAFMIIAARISGLKKFTDEFNRLNDMEKVYLTPADSMLANLGKRKLTAYEKKNGGSLLLGALEDCAAMEMIALDSCMCYSNAHTEHWKKSMRDIWAEGILALTPDNLAWRHVLYDVKTGHARPLPRPEMLDEKSALDWSWFLWRAEVLTPRSVMLARAGVQMSRWIPDTNAIRTALSVLKSVSADQMMFYLDPDGSQILPKHKYLTETLCADAVTNWLWAYWLARQQNLISSED